MNETLKAEATAIPDISQNNAIVEAPAQAMTPTDEANQFIAFLERAATDPSVDVGKMQALLSMKKEVLIEQRIASFNRDFLAAKQKMPRVKKDGSVEYPVDKNKPEGPKKEAFKFAKYEAIDEAIRPIEKEFGFSRGFTTAQRVGDGGGIVVIGTLMHRDGHTKEASIPVPLDTSGGKNNLQGYGSSFSYGKRYTTTMLWDIITEGEDNDGNFPQNIDDVQFEELQRLIDESGSDTIKFCAHLKIEALALMPNKLYPKAKQDLLDKIEVLKKKKPAAKGGI